MADSSDHSAQQDAPLVVQAQTPFLKLVRRGSWDFVQRANASGVVTVVALTPDDRVLLVEQYRPPLQASVIEFPAGLAGDLPGSALEPLEQAAHRELIEETGYEAAHMTPLFTGPSSAGITDETVAFFWASGLRRVSAGGGDASEKITVHEVPRATLDTWLREKQDRGCLLDARLFTGLYFVDQQRRAD